MRALALCVVLAGAETLHGIARTVLLVPRVGKEKAIKLSAFTGSALAFAICYLLVPPMGLQTLAQHLALGAVLAIFMASFDIGLGLWLLRKPWRKVLTDFDPRSGNWLLFGLAFLLCVPAFVRLLHPSS